MATNGSSRPTLDETHLLAWIEDELPDPQAQQVERALGSQPQIRDRVVAMRTDRLALAALGDETAPADLLVGVADLLEREMLVELTDDAIETAHSPIPISRVVPERGITAWTRRTLGGIGAVLGDRTGRRLAVAASLLLVAGGLSYVVSQVIHPAISASPLSTAPDEIIARADPSTPDPAIASHLPAGTEPVSTQPSAADRANDTPRVTAAATQPGTADDGAISPARAVELARAGRLVIRVHPADAARTLALLDRIGSASSSVRVFDALDGQLAGALQTRRAPTPKRPAQPEPIIIASDELPADHAPADTAQPSQGLASVDRPWRVAGLRLVELNLTERTLAAMLRSTPGAEFEAAPEPMDLPIASDPARVLWWGEPTSSWVPRTVVPVVVETRE